MKLQGFDVSLEQLTENHPPGYCQQVAEIHIERILHGVLPLLGIQLLSRIYSELSRLPQAGVWVALHDYQVIGFIAGCSDTRKTFRRLLFRLQWPIAVFIVESLFRHNLIKFVKIVLYPLISGSVKEHSFKECKSVKPEILSIAVSRDHQSNGLGQHLVFAFEEMLQDWQCKGMYRVASNISGASSNNFYLRNGFSPCHNVKLNDSWLKVYLKKIPERNSPAGPDTEYLKP
ncbi:MAG TPA: GNAT family N-acetyltransferase [Bacteroidales bacterium]|nr:GNAT family N-acetyltransferase [Bacteroidales bacterium]HPT09456.1 GNAT family N-acetyltransferase [Bacteroidales bacterium]